MATDTTTQYVSNVAPALETQFNSNVAEMIAHSKQPMPVYGGQRVASMDPMSIRAYEDSQYAGANTSAGYDTAKGYTQQGINSAYNPSMWGAGTMANYMNPYQSAVTNQALAAENQRYGVAQTHDASDMIRKGAFGGSRQAIMDAEQYKNHNSQLNSITTNGLMSAYNNAQQQFNTDRTAQQQGVQTGLAAANQYGALGGAQQNADIARSDNMNKYGIQSQLLDQNNKDVAYGDFREMRDWDTNQYMNNLNAMKSTGSTTNTVAPIATPSWAQTLLGAGIGAYGAYSNSKIGGGV